MKNETPVTAYVTCRRTLSKTDPIGGHHFFFFTRFLMASRLVAGLAVVVRGLVVFFDVDVRPDVDLRVEDLPVVLLALLFVADFFAVELREAGFLAVDELLLLEAALAALFFVVDLRGLGGAAEALTCLTCGLAEEAVPADDCRLVVGLAFGLEVVFFAAVEERVDFVVLDAVLREEEAVFLEVVFFAVDAVFFVAAVLLAARLRVERFLGGGGGGGGGGGAAARVSLSLTLGIIRASSLRTSPSFRLAICRPREARFPAGMSSMRSTFIGPRRRTAKSSYSSLMMAASATAP